MGLEGRFGGSRRPRYSIGLNYPGPIIKAIERKQHRALNGYREQLDVHAQRVEGKNSPGMHEKSRVIESFWWELEVDGGSWR
jgi:hypothetical protein